METGQEVSDMESENNSGQTDQNIWENGRKEKHMAKVSSSIQMVITMKEIGAITKHVVMDFIFMKMETNMRGNGKMMSSMGMEKNDGQTGLVIKVLTTKVQNTEQDFINGLTDRNITVIGTTMLLKEQGFILGQMDVNIEVNGRTLICMVLDHINGLTEEYLLENMIMIRNMVMGFTLGQMIESTGDGGRKENKMVQEYMLFMRKLKKWKLKVVHLLKRAF